MSRLDKVRSENMDEIVDISCIPYLKDKSIVILLKQISETLAMIYDDGFAGDVERAEKEKEEDDYGYYRCRYSKKYCKYADDFGVCMGNWGCMYKQREKSD